MYDRTALWVNGQYVSNAVVTLRYLHHAIATGMFPPGCEPQCKESNCCWQEDSPGGDTPATDASHAWWYNPAEPASGEFLGFMIEKIEDATTLFESRVMNQRVTRGGVASRRTVKPRLVKVTGQLIATTARGMGFGHRRLVQLMSSCDECAGAQGTMVIRDACPPEGSSEDRRRIANGVTLVSADEPKGLHPGDATCDAYWQDWTFTLGVEQPDWMTYPLTGVGFTNQPIIMGSAASCAAVSCCDPLRDIRRYQWRTAFGGVIDAGGDPVPSITINSGGSVLTRFRIEVHATAGNADAAGCLSGQQPLAVGMRCANPITVMEVTGLPPSSQLVIDGNTGRALAYIGGSTTPVPGEQYINPDGTAGARGLLGICGGICIVGAATALIPPSASATWSVSMQRRFKVL